MLIKSYTRFNKILELPEDKIDLIEAALIIAAEAYPDLDIEQYLQKFDELARRAQDYLGNVIIAKERVDQLSNFLFVEQNFVGSFKDYYDPRNSFLNEVLDRRIGIPITLAILYIGIAQRCGWNVHGINFPGHFLTKYVDEDEEIIIDPFVGKIISKDECQIQYQAIMRIKNLHELHYLKPATSKEILTRILGNLKNIYLNREDWESALSCCERILLLEPQAFIERRDRGVIYSHLEYFSEAIRDFEYCLMNAPEDGMIEDIQLLLAQIRHHSTPIN